MDVGRSRVGESASHASCVFPTEGLLMFIRVVSVFSHVAEVAIFSAAAVALTMGMLALR